jgi:hypothetical protein
MGGRGGGAKGLKEGAVRQAAGRAGRQAGPRNNTSKGEKVAARSLLSLTPTHSSSRHVTYFFLFSSH